MVLYIYGADTFRSRGYLRQSVEQFKKQRDPKGYNVLFLDGKKTPKEKIFAELRAAPFLAEKRLVVVENLLATSDKELLGEFVEKIPKIPESTVAIVWQGEAVGKTKEAKALQAVLAKEKYAREFPLLEGVRLVEWIAKEAEERGGKMEKEAAQGLANNYGGAGVWQLNSVIDQLVAFKNGQPITSADLKEFVEEKVDDNIFNLVDAVVGGNHRLALKLIAEQRARGEEDGHLFGLFLWQFRILIEMADLLEREGNVTSDELAKILKIHPFVARKNLAIARRYSLVKLEAIYGQMLEMDLKTKTSGADQGLLLDLFVAKV